MIDWKNSLPEHFHIEPDVEGIEDKKSHVVYPVRVFHTESGEEALLTHITIKNPFHINLKELPDWKDRVMTILNSRVKQQLLQRIQAEPQPIGDLVQLMDEPPKPVA
jgi:hypothetical protein